MTFLTRIEYCRSNAHYGLTNTWAFYQTKLGRNGIDSAGRKPTRRSMPGKGTPRLERFVFLHDLRRGASFFYPLVTLDIAGHEMSHGVTATEANLTYSGESEVNEATSDIFGTMVEFFANNAADTRTIGSAKKPCASTIRRSLCRLRPSVSWITQPTSPNCWFSGVGNLDVHLSSGPANHMFYLLSHGGTSQCNGHAVGGIGNDKAARIWYEALTNQMTASTNYQGARTAALAAAATLYGAGSPEQNAVAAAFSAIDVN
jgi:Zn-dependent metalloprotease